MGKGKWVGFGLTAALVVFGAGVTTGEVAKDLWPTASGRWGFIDGNQLHSWPNTAQVFYVAGAMDAFLTVLKELNASEDVKIYIAIFLARLITQQVTDTTTSAEDKSWLDLLPPPEGNSDDSTPDLVNAPLPPKKLPPEENSAPRIDFSPLFPTTSPLKKLPSEGNSADTNQPAIDWDPLLAHYRAAYEKEAAKVMAKLAYLEFNTSVSGVTLGQLTDLVVAYLKDHPEQRQNSAALLVWRALAQAEWK